MAPQQEQQQAKPCQPNGECECRVEEMSKEDGGGERMAPPVRKEAVVGMERVRTPRSRPWMCCCWTRRRPLFVWIHISLRACVLASASVIARARGRVVQMLCAPASFRAVSRAPHAQMCRHIPYGSGPGLVSVAERRIMLCYVVTCSNLLVLCLLGVWVVDGIEFDVHVEYSHIGSVSCRTTFVHF